MVQSLSQEQCLFLGQVIHNLLFKPSKLLTNQFLNLLVYSLVHSFLLLRNRPFHLDFRVLDIRVLYDFRLHHILWHIHDGLCHLLSRLSINLVSTCLSEQVNLICRCQLQWTIHPTDDLPPKLQINLIFQINVYGVGPLPVIPFNFST